MLRLERLDSRPWTELRAIERACYGDRGWDDYGLRMMPLLHGPLSLLALDDDHPIGYVVGARAEDGDGWILGLAVVPEARRRGVADQLLARCLERLAAAGLGRALLSVAPDNASALGLYQRHGFREIERDDAFFGEGEARLVLERAL